MVVTAAKCHVGSNNVKNIHATFDGALLALLSDRRVVTWGSPRGNNLSITQNRSKGTFCGVDCLHLFQLMLRSTAVATHICKSPCEDSLIWTAVKAPAVSRISLTSVKSCCTTLLSPPSVTTVPPPALPPVLEANAAHSGPDYYHRQTSDRPRPWATTPP